jgi:HEPN domain-containing protein
VVENSVKAVISLFKPVPKVHELDELVDDLIRELDFELEDKEKVEEIKGIRRIVRF